MMLYRAVVENNVHPDHNRKVQVRIYGFHTANNENSEDFENAATADLPWAEVLGSADTGLISGIGVSSVLKQGTWVWVSIMGDIPATVVVIGTIDGVSQSKIAYADGEGYCDPDGIYPIEARLKENDVNRLARVEKLGETIHQTINDTVDIVTKSDTISGAVVDQTQPNSLNDKSIYPNVEVKETASGHVLEFDDTLDNERIRVYHRTGSFIEIRPDGSFITKSVGAENHYIHAGDIKEHIAKGVKTYIEENMEQIISGGVKQQVEMDKFQHINGFLQITADGNLEIVNDVKITGKLQVTAGILSDSNIDSGAEITDSTGTMSDIRDTHNKHVTTQYNTHTHTGNLGTLTSKPAAPGEETTNPRVVVPPWSNSPLGFK
jgi:hypothetical protein